MLSAEEKIVRKPATLGFTDPRCFLRVLLLKEVKLSQIYFTILNLLSRIFPRST